MRAPATADTPPHSPSQAAQRRWWLMGYAYWLLFLLVLEPDNLLRADLGGTPLSLAHEFIRISLAALLGSCSVPIQYWLAARYPLQWGRYRIWPHLTTSIVLAFVLILLSCLLAAWVFERQWLPSAMAIRHEMIANGSLLSAVLMVSASLILLAQHWHTLHKPADEVTAPEKNAASPWLTVIPVTTRDGDSFVNTEDIDWMESQGNYVALHLGASTHLVRETLSRLEARLDPAMFVRIHRCSMVALRRVQAVKATGSGDGLITLLDQQVLKLSRSYRPTLKMRWDALNRVGNTVDRQPSD